MDDHNFKKLGKYLQRTEFLARLFSAKMRSDLHVIRCPEDFSDVLWMLHERFEHLPFFHTRPKSDKFRIVFWSVELVEMG